jgi:hypothetical protein
MGRALRRELAPFRRVRRSLLAAARRLARVRSEAAFWDRLERLEALPACVAFQPFAAARACWPLARGSSDQGFTVAETRAGARMEEFARELRRPADSNGLERARSGASARALSGGAGPAPALVALGAPAALGVPRPRAKHAASGGVARLAAALRRDRSVPNEPQPLGALARSGRSSPAAVDMPRSELALVKPDPSLHARSAEPPSAPHIGAATASALASPSSRAVAPGATLKGPNGLLDTMHPMARTAAPDDPGAAHLRGASGVTALAAAVEALWARTGANRHFGVLGPSARAGAVRNSGSNAAAVQRAHVRSAASSVAASSVAASSAAASSAVAEPRTVAVRASSLLLPAFGEGASARGLAYPGAPAGEARLAPSSNEPDPRGGADLVEPLQQLLVDQARARGVDLT